MNGRTLMIYLGATIAAAVMVAGFWFAGTPMDSRERSHDKERVRDLKSLSNYIDMYYRRYDKLPDSIDKLLEAHNNGSWITNQATDPVTEQYYHYEPLTETTYKLCTHFDQAFAPEEHTRNRESKHFERMMAEWSHNAGWHCFERTTKNAIVHHTRNSLLSGQLRAIDVAIERFYGHAGKLPQGFQDMGHTLGRPVIYNENTGKYRYTYAIVSPATYKVCVMELDPRETDAMPAGRKWFVENNTLCYQKNVREE